MTADLELITESTLNPTVNPNTNLCTASLVSSTYDYVYRVKLSSGETVLYKHTPASHEDTRVIEYRHSSPEDVSWAGTTRALTQMSREIRKQFLPLYYSKCAVLVSAVDSDINTFAETFVAADAIIDGYPLIRNIVVGFGRGRLSPILDITWMMQCYPTDHSLEISPIILHTYDQPRIWPGDGRPEYRAFRDMLRKWREKDNATWQDYLRNNVEAITTQFGVSKYDVYLQVQHAQTCHDCFEIGSQDSPDWAMESDWFHESQFPDRDLVEVIGPMPYVFTGSIEGSRLNHDYYGMPYTCRF
jgi:hypothetical protein